MSRGLFCALLMSVLAGCFSGRPPGPQTGTDRQWYEQMRAGREAFAAADVDTAADAFAAALERARLRAAGSEIAPAAYNLAAVSLARGQLERAAALLDEADLDAAPDSALAVDIARMRARITWLRGDATTAAAELDRLLGRKGLDAARRLMILLQRGLVACQAGEMGPAREALAAWQNTPEQQSLPGRADALALRGCVALAEHQPERAAELWLEESDLRRQAGQYRRMVAALEQAADAFARAGSRQQAARQLYRAGLSLVSQGQTDSARVLLLRARVEATAAGDASLGQRIDKVLDGMKQP
ncbi:MAG: hypothetical protein Tsb0017_24740 [Geothermobacteraceae bacterium]